MFDVAIIGAGMSGLQAAVSAKRAGLSFCVIEARDRLGGKVSEDERLEFPFGMIPDVGFTNLLCGPAQFKFMLTRCLVSTGKKRNLEMIRDHIEAESQKKKAPKLQDDQVSLNTYVRKLGATEKTCKMVNLWVRAMHGLESSEESAVHFIDYYRRNHGLLAARADDHTGGNYLRLQGGRCFKNAPPQNTYRRPR